MLPDRWNTLKTPVVTSSCGAVTGWQLIRINNVIVVIFKFKLKLNERTWPRMDPIFEDRLRNTLGIVSDFELYSQPVKGENFVAFPCSLRRRKVPEFQCTDRPFVHLLA